MTAVWCHSIRTVVNAGFIDTYRYFYSDQEGIYTEVFGYDHCPVELDIEL